jgi:serine/threonine protein kinase
MNYRIIKKPIGKGATSRVFIGRDPQNQKVALKKVPNILEAEQEVNIMMSFSSHQQLITLLDFFIEENCGYIVMEYFPGRRLGNFKKGEIRDSKLAVQITIKVLEGLQVLHEHGILHCDITPHNILMINDLPESVKIIDFGSSVRKNAFNEYIGVHKGATMWYRPPELKKQMDGFRANLNNSSDLYSAACVCLYLINGKAPFRKRLACEQINDEGLRKVLRKATRGNKQKRFQTAQEFIQSLLPFS